MSNERIDEFLSWRGQLDDPRGIPGQGLDDREATWERLMDKISETPRRRRFFGYRLAAACLLLALIPAVRLFQGRHVRIATTRPVELRRVVTPTPLPAQADVPEFTQAPETAQAPEANPKTPTGPKTAAGTAPTTTALRTHRPSRSAAPATPMKLAELTVPATVSVAPPDSAVYPKITRKPLKNNQLRVVHINELPGASGPAPAVTATDAGRHFQFFLSPAQGRLAVPPPPPAADPVLLKVKLFSSN